MAIDEEVRDHIFSVLEGAENLAAFKEWFVSSTWDERTRLVAHVDHLLAEAVGDDAEALEGLRKVASNIVIGGEVTTTTSQSGQTLFETVAYGDVEVTRSPTYRGRMAFAGR